MLGIASGCRACLVARQGFQPQLKKTAITPDNYRHAALFRHKVYSESPIKHITSNALSFNHIIPSGF